MTRLNPSVVNVLRKTFLKNLVYLEKREPKFTTFSLALCFFFFLVFANGDLKVLSTVYRTENYSIIFPFILFWRSTYTKKKRSEGKKIIIIKERRG